jgi:hypothetical protein
MVLHLGKMPAPTRKGYEKNTEWNPTLRKKREGWGTRLPLDLLSMTGLKGILFAAMEGPFFHCGSLQRIRRCLLTLPSYLCNNPKCTTESGVGGLSNWQ